MQPPETPRAAEAARGAHVLEVTGYSSLRTGVGGGAASRCIQSAAFAVGGYDWAVRFYPDGDGAPGSEGHVSAQLALVSLFARVTASFNLGLVDRATGVPAFEPQDETAVFDTSTSTGVPAPGRRERSPHGSARLLMKRCELEASPAYLLDDAVAVACAVTVVSGATMPPRSRCAPSEVEVPEPDLPWHVGELLVSREGADVTFDVDGEAFAAHGIILAARSPVFEAELYGPATMETDDTRRITVPDMRPAVFRALLHFIYTDSLPAMGDLGSDEMRDLVPDLLAAADRYTMDRLKVVCEHILARTLRLETVASTLVLADRHRCDGLRDACIDFMAHSDQMGDGAAKGIEEEDR